MNADLITVNPRSIDYKVSMKVVLSVGNKYDIKSETDNQDLIESLELYLSTLPFEEINKKSHSSMKFLKCIGR